MSETYSEREDVATGVRLREQNQDDPKDLLRSPLEAHDPYCGGCVRHRKAMMLTLGNVFNQPYYDVFLEAPSALAFIKDVDALRETKSLRPVVVSFDLVLAEKTQSILLYRREFDALCARIDRIRGEVETYAANFKPDDFILAPQRAKPVRPMTPEEHAQFVKTSEAYYKKEPRDIQLGDLDPGLLLAALYNNAKTGGVGLLSYNNATMTPLEGRHIFEELKRTQTPPRFDCINGRSIKCWFDKKEGQNVLSFSRFWDYNDLPVATVIEMAKAGLYRRLPEQGVLDTKNEAKILAESLTKRKSEDGASPIEGLVERLLKEQEEAYIQAATENDASRTYQISIDGTGEVGQQIRPFSLRKALKLLPGGKAGPGSNELG